MFSLSLSSVCIYFYEAILGEALWNMVSAVNFFFFLKTRSIYVKDTWKIWLIRTYAFFFIFVHLFSVFNSRGGIKLSQENVYLLFTWCSQIFLIFYWKIFRFSLEAKWFRRDIPDHGSWDNCNHSPNCQPVYTWSMLNLASRR